MADLNVQNFLEQVINTQTKLHILLIFHENPRMQADLTSVAQRCCRDIWSIGQALQELSKDGLLVICQHVGGEPEYKYMPNDEYIEPIEALMHIYDDPVERQTLLSAIGELSEYAALRYTNEYQPGGSLPSGLLNGLL
jgi:hypothetical protein